MTARPFLRPRAFLALGIAAALLFSACSGKSKSASSTSSTTRAPSAIDTPSGVSTVPTTAKPPCVTAPGKQTARIRFVNLYTNDTYPTSAVDVWQGQGASDPCAKKLTTVPYGQASDYIDVTASDAAGNWSAAAYVADSTDKDHQIVVQDEMWLGGEQATMVFEGAKPQAGVAASAGSGQAFLEKNNVGEPALLLPTPSTAALGVMSALDNVVANDAWVLGSAKSGCIAALGDTASTHANVGGSQLVRYSVAPGSLDLALYPSNPGTCTGTPDIGPVTVDAKPGSSTFVFAYGPDAKHLALLVLPIAP